MKRFAVTVFCFCIYFVGHLNAIPLTDEEYKYVYQYSLTPPDDDYFPMILEEFVRLEDPFKTTSIELNETDATETETSASPSTTASKPSTITSNVSTTPTNVSTTPTNVLTTTSNVSTKTTNVSTTTTNASTTPTNVLTTTTNVSTTTTNVSETPITSGTSTNVSTTPTYISTTATNVSCVNETSRSKITGAEMSSSQAPTTSSPTVVATTKKWKFTAKGDGLDSSMYIVRKGDIPEIIGLNIGLYYVLRDTKKKMEKDEEISVKPLIRILALTEKIKKLEGRIHPRNQDLMKKIYGETLKNLANSSS